MSLNFCDLLVLGSDLSGVIAATLLAKRGMNVLVLDDVEEGDRSANVATGLDTRAFRSLLSKLMIPESKLQIIQGNKVTCQVVLPRHRIDLTPSRPQLVKEIGREFPAERDLFLDLLTETDQLREKVLEELLSFLPITHRKEGRLFTRWLKTLPDQKIIALWEKMSPTLQMIVRLQLRFLSRGSLLEPLSVQLLLYLSPESGLSFSLRGGANELRKIFFEKLDYFGGLVHPLGGDDFEILAKGREIRGLKLNRYGFPTRCRFLMGNLNVQRFYASLPRNIWSLWAKRKMAERQPAESEHLLQFEIPRDRLPVAMKENVVLIPNPDQALQGINYLELNLTPVSKTEDERMILSVIYRVPFERSMDKEFHLSCHGEIERHLAHLIPFSEGLLKKIFPEAAEEGLLFPKETRDLPRFLYPPSFFFPPLRTPFKNALLLGPNSLDWLGMEGKILTALKGVEEIWRRDSRKT